MGAQAALEVASAGVDDLVLVDIVPGLAEGEALDISHKLSETGVDVSVTGSTDFSSHRGRERRGHHRRARAEAGDDEDGPAGEERGDSRRPSPRRSRSTPPDAVAITVTNPMDVMNYVVQEATGFPVDRVVGMGGVLDLSRFKHVLSLKLGVSRSSIMALVIGEHGENMLPLARYTSIGGVPLTSILDADGDRGDHPEHPTGRDRRDLQEGRDRRRPGKRDRQDGEGGRLDRKEVLPASTFLDGKYGRAGSLHRRPADAGRRRASSRSTSWT